MGISNKFQPFLFRYGFRHQSAIFVNDQILAILEKNSLAFFFYLRSRYVGLPCHSSVNSTQKLLRLKWSHKCQIAPFCLSTNHKGAKSFMELPCYFYSPAISREYIPIPIEIEDRLGSSWFRKSLNRFENSMSLGHTYCYPRPQWPGTTYAQWGNRLHCTAKNQLAHPHF